MKHGEIPFQTTSCTGRTLQPKRPADKVKGGGAGYRRLAASLLLAVALCTGAPQTGAAPRQASTNPVRQMLLDAHQKRWSAAEKDLALAHDPLATKVFFWLYFTQGHNPAQFRQVATFIRANPDWPLQSRMRLLAENVMPDDLPDGEAAAWFDEHSPQTAQGIDHYVMALIRIKKPDKAAEVMREEWKTAGFTVAQQTYFMRKYAPLLDRDTMLLRLDYLLSSGQDSEARAIAASLGGYYPAVAEARIALATGRPDAFKFLAAIPATLQQDPAILLEELRWERRRNNDFAALQILHNMPPPEKIPNPDEWWTERNIMVRRLMDNKQYESAYLLAADHGLKEGSSYADAEFLSGWLALRFMHLPWEAFKHFEKLYKSTTSPISRARGAYWAGKASEGLGFADVARQWYQAAAKHQTTFYGQLAIGELKEEFRPPQQLPPQKTLDGSLAFEKKDMVRAARMLSAAGMTDETTYFLDALGAGIRTPEEYRLTAELAENLRHPQNAVRIAKKALTKNVLLMDQLYPTILSRMRNVTIEWALAHALIRQESAFDFKAQSGAGALGLMQLMPATAKHVAKKNHLPYSVDLLTESPDYNIQIGSLYFKELLDHYKNSYPLALAAYNCGPARVDNWLVQWGDPRQGAIGFADWIELIPIAETRNYVQRVLESVYIYRLKLKDVQKSYSSQTHTALSGGRD